MTIETMDAQSTGETGAANAAAGSATPDTGANQPDSGAANAATQTAATESSSTTDTRQTPEDPQALLRDASAQAPAPVAQPGAPTSLQGAPNPLNGQVPAPSPVATLPPEIQQLLATPEGIKELLNQRRAYGSIAREVGDLRKKSQAWDGLDPQVARQLLSERQHAAQVANLKPFQRQHPEYSKTMDRVSKVKGYMAALNAAPPEMRDDPGYRGRLAQQMRVTAEDAKLHDEFDEHRENAVQQLATDPESFIDTRVEQIVQARLVQFEQAIQNRGHVQHVLDTNQELITKHRDDIMRAMENPNRHEVALEMARLKEEVETLRSKVVQDSRHVETAKAQRQIAQGRASETGRRDPASTAIIRDPSEDLIKSGANPKDIFTALSRHASNLKNQG